MKIDSLILQLDCRYFVQATIKFYMVSHDVEAVSCNGDQYRTPSAGVGTAGDGV